MSKRIYRVDELVTSTDNLDLLENITRYYLDDKNELPFKIYVAGGDNYGNGLEKYSKPHFHVIVDGINTVEKLRINIPTLEEWNTNKNIEVVYSTVKDYNHIIDKIIKWFDITQKGSFGITNNLKNTITMWNISNARNKNVDQINTK